MKKVTIQEIAKELGLSRNTVSKAIAGSETVAEETRYAILKKAYEMGYAKLKTPLPKELKEDCKKTVVRTVLVIGKEASAFWHRIIMGISEGLGQNNCKFQLCMISSEEEDRLELPSALLDHEVDGIILLSVLKKSFVEKMAASGLPMVFLDAPCNTDDYNEFGDIVISESFNSVRKITQSLIAQGMRRIAFIGDTTYCRSIMDRFQGFVWAHKQSGIELDRSIIKTAHQKERYYDKEEVEMAINSMPYIPDAICCANDDIAKDVYLVLKQKGIFVPRDVAVVGFDNKEEAEIMSPPLTTVAVHNHTLGLRLVKQLLYRMDNPSCPNEMIIVNTDVVFRESSVRIRE